MPDIGYYTLPVLLSFDGIDKQVNSSLGKAFGGKKIGAQMGKDIADGLKSTEADVKQAVGGYAKLYDKWADATDKVKVAQAGLEDLQRKGIDSGQRYERAVAAQNKALRDQQRALREAKDGFGDYERALKSASSAGDDFGGGFFDKLKGMASGVKDSGTEMAGGFVEGFGGPIAAIGTKGGPIGLALAAAAALGLGAGALIGQQVMAGMEAEASADLIQARLGIDEASMAKISGAAGKAYADNFGESLQANMSAAQSAIESGLLSGADDPNTQAVIERLSTVSQLLGEEIPRVSRSASQLIKTGIAKDMNEAFDLIVKGQQSGLNVSEDWLDTLDEYSTQFRKLGLSGADTLGLLSQMTKAGARDTDVAADAIKEFSIRAIDGTEATNTALLALGLDWQKVPQELAAGGDRARNAFDQVIKAIQRVEDPVQKASLQVALFGTQSEDLGDALNAMDLSTAVAQLGEVDGAAQRAADTMGDNTAASVETAKRALETGAASMQRSLADAFGPGVEQIATWLTENQDTVTGWFTTGANAAAEFGGIVLGMGSAVTGGLGMVLTVIGDTTSFMLDSFASIAGGAATVADALGQDGLAEDLRGAQNTLTGMANKFDDMGTEVMAFAGTLSNGAQSLHNFDANLVGTTSSAQNAQAQIAGVRTAIETLPGGKQIDINAVVVFRDQAGRAIDPSQLLGFNPAEFANAGAAQRARRGDDARPGDLVTPSVQSVGPAAGPGSPMPNLAATSATPPAVQPSRSSSGGGGGSGSGSSEPPPMFDRSLWGVDPQSSGMGYPGDAALLANVPAGRYTQEQRGDLTQGLADCSSAVEDLVNLLDGRPTGGASMSTHNADEWLQARGFLPGRGGPGDFRVGFNSGHMQATLPGGTPFNWGSDAAAARGGVGGSGADDPAFTSHYYRPVDPGQMISRDAMGYGSTNLLDPSVTGTAGGYEVDPQAVFEAESDVMQERNELEQKRLRLLELEAKGNATQSELLAARNDVTEQEREWQSAQMKLAEAQRGKFKEAKQSGSSSSRQSGMGQFGPLGDILGSFFKETFGFDGSFLPALDSLFPVQAAGTLLDAFAPQLQALVDGAAPNTAQAGAQTGAAAFGMPDVAVPPMPPAGVHTGAGGAPGPSQIVQVDASQNFGPGSTIGWDPARAEKERKAGLARAIPRIPPGP